MEPDSEIISHFLKEICISQSNPISEELKSCLANKRVAIPEHLALLLDDFSLAVDGEASHNALIAPRLQAILLQLLCMAKKTVIINLPNDPDDVVDGPDYLYWRSQQQLSLKHRDQQSPYTLPCIVDYLLWYGSREELETNLIVVRKDLIDQGQRHGPLVAMSMINHARKTSGRDAGVYGISTDSSQWTFLHLTNAGRASPQSAQATGQFRC